MTLLSTIFYNNIDTNNFCLNKPKQNRDITINIDVSNEEGYFCYFYFSRLNLKSGYDYKIKFKLFKEILENIFLTETLKTNIINIFCKLQRVFFSLSKFTYIWKYKRATIKVNDDLSLNTIDITKKNIFVLFQDNSKYLFVSNDLINIINKNLSNSPGFFAEPLTIKNPYNNIVLNNSTLYNIYFFLKFRVCNVPILFELFFKSNFNLKNFVYDDECIIRNINIDNYVKFSDNKTLHNQIKYMLNENIDIMHKIIVHKDFPKNLLIKIFRPYLYLYISSKFQILGTIKRHNSNKILRNKLHDFAKFNPLFGRKKLNINRKFGKIKGPLSLEYNDKHINFYNPQIFKEYQEDFELDEITESDEASESESDEATESIQESIQESNLQRQFYIEDDDDTEEDDAEEDAEEDVENEDAEEDDNYSNDDTIN